MNWEERTPKQQLLAIVDDLVSDFLYYDRKEDPEFPVGKIQEMIESGVITEEEIVTKFRTTLHQGVA